MATIEAAGVLFITPQGKGLFLLRGPGGDAPYQWGVPGGKAEDGEDAADTAIRETEEECGRKVPKKDLALLTRSISPRSMPPAPPMPEPASAEVPAPVPEPELVDWTTFAVKVDAEFTPEPDDEHEGYAWAPLACPPEPLHPGVRTALERLQANELGVARMMAEGRLTSPQRFANVMLWDMRITGTGYAYRKQREEHVWREPSEWLTEDLVARCNGMPVIMEHPQDKAVLDSKEFNKRIVGMVFLPYIKPEIEEVWGIVKVFDDAANEMLSTYELSTSPGVLVGADSQVFKHPGGKTTLVESDPLYVDHLAICGGLGVWDKNEEPHGVRVDSAADREPPLDSARLDAAVIAASRFDSASILLRARR